MMTVSMDELVDLARQVLERDIAAGTPEQADARIARLNERGQYSRAQKVLAARIKAFGELGV